MQTRRPAPPMIKLADTHPTWAAETPPPAPMNLNLLARRAEDTRAEKTDQGGHRSGVGAWLQRRLTDITTPSRWDAGTLVGASASAGGLYDALGQSRALRSAAAEAERQYKAQGLDGAGKGSPAHMAVLDRIGKNMKDQHPGANPVIHAVDAPIDRGPKATLGERILVTEEYDVPSGKVQTTTLPAGLAHELGHATGDQSLNKGMRGRLSNLGGNTNYRAVRGLGNMGVAGLARSTLANNDLSEKDKATRLGLLSAVSGGLAIPGLHELAEEHRAYHGGLKLLDGLPTHQADYKRLQGMAHGAYRASHLAPLLTTAAVGGLAARSAWRAHHEKK